MSSPLPTAMINIKFLVTEIVKATITGFYPWIINMRMHQHGVARKGDNRLTGQEVPNLIMTKQSNQP